MRILAPAFKIKCALCASVYVRVYALCARTPAFVTLPVCFCVCEESIEAYSLHGHTKKNRLPCSVASVRFHCAVALADRRN